MVIFVKNGEDWKSIPSQTGEDSGETPALRFSQVLDAEPSQFGGEGRNRTLV